MIDMLQLSFIPTAKLTQEGAGKPGQKGAKEVNLDFAALLMGLIQPQAQVSGQLNLLTEDMNLSAGELPLNLDLESQLFQLSMLVKGMSGFSETDLTSLVSLINPEQAVDHGENNGQQILNQLLNEEVAKVKDFLEKGLKTVLTKGMVEKSGGQTDDNKNHGGFELDLANNMKPKIENLPAKSVRETAFETKVASLKGEDKLSRENLLTSTVESLKDVEKQINKQEKVFAQDLDAKGENSLQANTFPAELGKVKAEEAWPKEVMLPKQLTSIFQQLVDQSKLTISKGKSEVEIKLKPEFLGKVLLKVALEEGVLTAKLAVENLMVAKALESNLNQLKNYLQEQGLYFEQVNVEISNGSLDQNPKEAAYQQQGFNSLASKVEFAGSEEEVAEPLLGPGIVNYLA